MTGKHSDAAKLSWTAQEVSSAHSPNTRSLRGSPPEMHSRKVGRCGTSASPRRYSTSFAKIVVTPARKVAPSSAIVSTSSPGRAPQTAMPVHHRFRPAGAARRVADEGEILGRRLRVCDSRETQTLRDPVVNVEHDDIGPGGGSHVVDETAVAQHDG